MFTFLVQTNQTLDTMISFVNYQLQTAWIFLSNYTPRIVWFSDACNHKNDFVSVGWCCAVDIGRLLSHVITEQLIANSGHVAFHEAKHLQALLTVVKRVVDEARVRVGYIGQKEVKSKSWKNIKCHSLTRLLNLPQNSSRTLSTLFKHTYEARLWVYTHS